MKPDQLIKRRGKLGLIKVNADYKTVQEWITQRMNKDQQVCYQKLAYILYLLTAMAKLVHKIRAFKIKYIYKYFLLVFVTKDSKTAEKQNC